MTDGDGRPEWLQRCDEVNATETRKAVDEDVRRLAADPLVILLVVTAYMFVYPFIWLYRRLPR